jgi:hypothetical protein
MVDMTQFERVFSFSIKTVDMLNGGMMHTIRRKFYLTAQNVRDLQFPSKESVG